MLLASALLFSITGTSCSNDDNTTPEKEKTYDMSGFAKGADVSWLTTSIAPVARSKSACLCFVTSVSTPSAFVSG